jgi:aminopeptidase YwaD
MYSLGMHYFTVTVTDSNNNCASTYSIMVYIIEHFGIAETGDDGIRVYPDPAKSFINIDFNESWETTFYIEILNSQGKQVYQDDKINIVPGSVICLNVSHLANGAYLLKIRDAHKKYIKKLVISKK